MIVEIFSVATITIGGNIIFLSPSDTPPPLGWRFKLFSCPRGHGGDDFIFSKMILHPPPPHFLSDLKISVATRHTPSLDGDQKGWGLWYFFGKKINFMLRFLSWVMKEFRLSFDGVGVLDGDRNSLLATKGANQFFLIIHPCGD